MTSKSIKSKYRSHTCNCLRSTDAGTEAKLSGWVMRKRDHGGVLFVDLRDNYGVTQVVFPNAIAPQFESVRVESVVEVVGEVILREANLINSKIPTGEIELRAKEFKVLSTAEVLPFQVAEDDGAPESILLKHRFLDLRRSRVHQNILMRSKVIKTIRELMHDEGFNEFQTPILTSSSPEGARDFIVPSRLHPGKFYALPQAPQQFKQLLMVSGFDRYFQIAPCFRDEDARADRSPTDFYQLDLEMSFVEQDHVLSTLERVFSKLFSIHSKTKSSTAPYRRLSYNDALNIYGSDKPDLRVGLTISKVSDIFAKTSFRVFQGILQEGGNVFAIRVPVKEVPSRKYFDDLVTDFTKATGGGLGYLIFENNEVRGSFQKLVSAEEVAGLKAKLEIGDREVLFIAAGKDRDLLPHLGKVRLKVGKDLGHFNANGFEFLWITDFPFYELNSETGKLDFGHNPFTMPQGGMDSLLNKDPLTILAHQWDLVINGYEIGSGAIRNHNPEIMYKAFELVGYGRDVVEDKFGGMIRAFNFGAPPHGGCGLGIERIVMLLCGEEAVREVIAFPAAQNGEDLLMSAPSGVSEKQLREVHIQVVLPEKEKA